MMILIKLQTEEVKKNHELLESWFGIFFPHRGWRTDGGALC